MPTPAVNRIRVGQELPALSASTPTMISARLPTSSFLGSTNSPNTPPPTREKALISAWALSRLAATSALNPRSVRWATAKLLTVMPHNRNEA